MSEKDNNEMSREERLALEDRAIQTLLELGVKFEVPLRVEPKDPPGLVSWWNRRFKRLAFRWRDRRLPADWRVEKRDVPDIDEGRMRPAFFRVFHIRPLYLGTIDILRKLYLRIEYDEKAVQENPLQESKKLFKYIPVMARIAAVAVLNDPSVKDLEGGKVGELSAFFIENLNVARLQRLCMVIGQMMDAGGFTNSIRSIREIGQTRPRPDVSGTGGGLVER